jgi:dipeptidyl aminopeptidase/acylaminoacyl peptidase
VKDQIYLAPWDEAAGRVGAAVQLTHVSGGADGAVWSPDSRKLMFVAGVYPECSVRGGTKANAGVLRSAQNDNPNSVEVSGTRDVVGWKGAEPAGWAEEDACDKAKDDAAAASPVKGQVWDALLYRHWDHYVGAKRSHIIEADFSLGGANPRDLTPRSAVGDVEVPTYFVGSPQEYAWAPDSKEIAYVAKLDPVPAASTNNDVYTLRLDEPGAKAVKVSTSPGSDDEPEYSPDGKWLAFRSQARDGFESDKFRLMLLDREKKTIQQLMPKFDGWVDELAWAPEGRDIYFASGHSGAEDILDYRITDHSLTVRTAGVMAFENSEDSQIFRSENRFAEYSDIQSSADGKTLVASMMTVRAPAGLVALTVDDREEIDDTMQKVPRRAFDGSIAGRTRNVLFAVRRITRLNDPILSGLDLQRMESFTFKGADATEVQGFLLRPPNFDSAKKYPVKFLMHGGPQTAWGDAWSFRWNWELMASSGYVVVGINRRGSTGYGQKFVDEVSGDWGGRAYVDLMKGLDYAESKYPFMDKTRECALGASYGGFMADWVLTHTNRFKCIVTHDGLYDPESAYGDTEEMWFNEWEFRRPEDFPKGWDGFTPTSQKRDVGHPDGHPAEPWRYQNLPASEDPFRKWSPMLSIQNAKTPTLVIHSQKDYRLDVSQGMELFTALQRLGVPSKMLYFPDEGHWILKPQNSQLWNEVVGDWCDRWTKTGKYAEGD